MAGEPGTLGQSSVLFETNRQSKWQEGRNDRESAEEHVAEGGARENVWHDFAV